MKVYAIIILIYLRQKVETSIKVNENIAEIVNYRSQPYVYLTHFALILLSPGNLREVERKRNLFIHRKQYRNLLPPHVLFPFHTFSLDSMCFSLSNLCMHSKNRLLQLSKTITQSNPPVSAMKSNPLIKFTYVQLSETFEQSFLH